MSTDKPLLPEVVPDNGHFPTLAQLRLSKLVLLLGDAMAMAMGFVFATLVLLGIQDGTWLQWWQGQDSRRLVAWAGIAVAGLLLVLVHFQHYSDRQPFWDELEDLLKLVSLLALVDISLAAIARWNASRLWWLVSWVLTLACLVLTRAFMRRLLLQLRLWTRPTIIVGAGGNACDAQRALESHPELGLSVIGFIDADSLDSEPLASSANALQLVKIRALASQPGVYWVLAVEHTQAEQREQWLRMLAQWGATDISVIPAMRGVPLYGTDMSHFFSHEVALLRIRNNLRRWPARLMKRIFDTMLASILLFLLSPMLLVLTVMVRTDGGPAFFTQPRIGKRGRVFHCYKFRSMVVNAESELQRILSADAERREEWAKERKLRKDPRISPIGHFLRRTSLDELPQLFNVILGDMSLVGPRPIVRSELRRYGQDADYYLMVRPGITGLWQVSGRSDLDYEKRVYLDTWYVKNWSIWYDVVILFKTIQAVWTRAGAY